MRLFFFMGRNACLCSDISGLTEAFTIPAAEPLRQSGFFLCTGCTVRRGSHGWRERRLPEYCDFWKWPRCDRCLKTYGTSR